MTLEQMPHAIDPPGRLLRLGRAQPYSREAIGSQMLPGNRSRPRRPAPRNPLGRVDIAVAVSRCSVASEPVFR